MWAQFFILHGGKGVTINYTILNFENHPTMQWAVWSFLWSPVNAPIMSHTGVKLLHMYIILQINVVEMFKGILITFKHRVALVFALSLWSGFVFTGWSSIHYQKLKSFYLLELNNGFLIIKDKQLQYKTLLYKCPLEDCKMHHMC